MSDPNIACLHFCSKWLCHTIPSPTPALPQWKTREWGRHPQTSSFAVKMTFWALRNLRGSSPLMGKRRQRCKKFQMFIKTIWHPGELIGAHLLPRLISSSLHLCVAIKTASAGRASGDPLKKSCRRRRQGQLLYTCMSCSLYLPQRVIKCTLSLFRCCGHFWFWRVRATLRCEMPVVWLALWLDSEKEAVADIITRRDNPFLNSSPRQEEEEGEEEEGKVVPNKQKDDLAQRRAQGRPLPQREGPVSFVSASMSQADMQKWERLKITEPRCPTHTLQLSIHAGQSTYSTCCCLASVCECEREF